MAQRSIKTIEPIIHQIIKESRERWGQDLVSIVVFGSFAGGEVHDHSDIDLLLIVKNLVALSIGDLE